MSTTHKHGRSRGGLACVYLEKYRVRKKITGERSSFQYAVWNIKINQKKFINFVCIYNPPPSTKNPSNSLFVDEFSNFLAENIMKIENVVIAGDFNIKINNIVDNDAAAFNDMMYALGFDRHVNFPTHIQGNILDLIFTENQHKLKILQCNQVPFFSDHCAVTCILSINKSSIRQAKVSYRKLKIVNAVDFMNDMDPYKIMEAEENINTISEIFDAEENKALDKHATLKQNKMTIREKKPWYSEEVQRQKKIFRNRERTWKKYGTPETLTTRKVERH